MAVYKEKKNVRQRGNNSHGWGAKKKHRGAGHRGGHGLAGTGKRGDAKRPRIWKNRKYFGKYGFTPHGLVDSRNAINLSILDKQKDTLVEEKKATLDKDTYTINLEGLGYAKLLGKGKIESKLVITVPMASAKAIAKVEEKGGSVKLTAQDAEAFEESQEDAQGATE
jgi:large subunit ribosomal protein L15